MEKLRLVAWPDPEVHAERLRSLGYEVDASPVPVPFRNLVGEGTRAVVIDLSRRPSHGRDVGVALRTAKRTRDVPLVFAGGEPEKVARVREVLPDASFTSWARVGAALRRARPPREPVVPSSNLAGYSGTPLPKKLGIREGSVVVLVGAPRGFERLLGDDGVVRHGARGRRDLTIVFVDRPGDVERTWGRLAADVKIDDVWIVWAKKSSPRYAGVTQELVRKHGLERSFVDFKVCAVDETGAGCASSVADRGRASHVPCPGRGTCPEGLLFEPRSRRTLVPGAPRPHPAGVIRPRSLILAPGATYHVAARGNRRAEIVTDDVDCRWFFTDLTDVVRRLGWCCHAYCLLTNHYHLLVETPKPDLPNGMYRLNQRYAQRFNRRHDYVGHLFQGRYYAELVETDEHFLSLARYIHLNPVRAGLTAAPEDWPWSGCAATLGLTPCAPFFSPDDVLLRFSKDLQRARVEYALFLRAEPRTA